MTEYLTHPDILKMERDGYIGDEPKVIGECCFCGGDILEGENICNVYDDIVCDDDYCKIGYMDSFKRVGA